MVLVLAGLWVGQNVSLLPLDASSNAPVYDSLFQVLFSIGTILFVGVTGLLVFSLVRFRRRRGDLGDGVAIEGNLPLESSGRPSRPWWCCSLVSTATTSTSAWAAWPRSTAMRPCMPSTPRWPWPARTAPHGHGRHRSGIGGRRHPQERVWGGIATNSGDALPVDSPPCSSPSSSITRQFHHQRRAARTRRRPVQLRMEARDVIHAFWVPQFRLKQDVIPASRR